MNDGACNCVQSCVNQNCMDCMCMCAVENYLFHSVHLNCHDMECFVTLSCELHGVASVDREKMPKN